MNPHLVRLVGGGEATGPSGPIPLSDSVLIKRRDKRIAYLKKLGECAVASGHQALEHCGLIFEEVARQWLASHSAEVALRRSVYFRYFDDVGTEHSEARELDGLVNGSVTPPRLVEVVVSVQGVWRYLRKKSQVLESLRILRQIMPDLQPLVVYIAVGPEPIQTYPKGICTGLELDLPALQSYRVDGLTFPIRPRDALVPCVVLPLRKLFAYANANGWNLHPSLLRYAKRFAQARYRRRRREGKTVGMVIR